MIVYICCMDRTFILSRAEAGWFKAPCARRGPLMSLTSISGRAAGGGA